MSSSTKLLKEYIREVVAVSHPLKKKLWVFDFDDTLVKTDAKVHVTNEDGSKFDLTPGEFAVYEKRPGQVFDYTDFQKLINPRAIKWTNRILRHVYEHHGADRVVILSARSSDLPIIQFLSESALHGIEVVALDNADPHVKASWISRRIENEGLDEVEFLDDSHKNVAAVRELKHAFPNVKVTARCIDHSRIASLHS